MIWDCPLSKIQPTIRYTRRDFKASQMFSRLAGLMPDNNRTLFQKVADLLCSEILPSLIPNTRDLCVSLKCYNYIQYNNVKIRDKPKSSNSGTHEFNFKRKLKSLWLAAMSKMENKELQLINTSYKTIPSNHL